MNESESYSLIINHSIKHRPITKFCSVFGTELGSKNVGAIRIVKG